MSDEQKIEVHEKGCLPSSCVPSCSHYVPRPPERERDLIDDCQGAAKLIWDTATAAPKVSKTAERIQTGTEAVGLFDSVLRLLGF